jgi:hypothetical protein
MTFCAGRGRPCQQSLIGYRSDPLRDPGRDPTGDEMTGRMTTKSNQGPILYEHRPNLVVTFGRKGI